MFENFTNDESEQTVERYGARSALAVYCGIAFFILLWFLLGLLGFYPLALQWFIIWTAFTTLCFLVVPPIHFLCREVIRLQHRVKELEKKLDHPNPKPMNKLAIILYALFLSGSAVFAEDPA